MYDLGELRSTDAYGLCQKPGRCHAIGFSRRCVRFKSEAPPIQQDVTVGSKLHSMPVSSFGEGSQDPCDSTKATDFRPLLDHQPQAASTWNVDLAQTKATTLAASCRLVLRSLPMPLDNQRADIPPPERKADCHKVSISAATAEGRSRSAELSVVSIWFVPVGKNSHLLAFVPSRADAILEPHRAFFLFGLA
jgi:hypothetical protein